ncbi:MAG: hypothetical protein JXA07_03990 [Spirochaetes bacterium]|nr:hypothetical protein [Spirochaetota bacterium]
MKGYILIILLIFGIIGCAGSSAQVKTNKYDTWFDRYIIDRDNPVEDAVMKAADVAATGAVLGDFVFK